MPTVPRPIRAAILVSLFQLVWCAAPARAWVFEEHVLLGYVAYHQACADIRKDDSLTLAQRQEVDQVLCNPDSLVSDAMRYGRLVAFLADHVEDNDSLESERAQLEASSFGTFVNLVRENAAHFWPEALQAYDSAQSAAMGLASEQSGTDRAYRTPALRRRLALNANAYAAHFLQDMFAAGHAGFSRANSGPNASRYYHDFWNKMGRSFADSSNKAWHAFGDGWISRHILGSYRDEWDMDTSIRGLKSIEALRGSFDTHCTAAAEDYQQGSYSLVAWYYGVFPSTLATRVSKCDDVAFENVSRVVTANADAIVATFLRYLGAPRSRSEARLRSVQAALPRHVQICLDKKTYNPIVPDLCFGPVLQSVHVIAGIPADPEWLDLEDPFPANTYNFYLIELEKVYLGAHSLDYMPPEGLVRARVQVNWFKSVGLNVLGLFNNNARSIRNSVGVGIDWTLDAAYGSLIGQSVGAAVVNLALTDEGFERRKLFVTGSTAEKHQFRSFEVYYQLEAKLGFLSAYLIAGGLCDTTDCGRLWAPYGGLGFSLGFGRIDGGTYRPFGAPGHN